MPSVPYLEIGKENTKKFSTGSRMNLLIIPSIRLAGCHGRIQRIVFDVEYSVLSDAFLWIGGRKK